MKGKISELNKMGLYRDIQKAGRFELFILYGLVKGKGKTTNQELRQLAGETINAPYLSSAGANVCRYNGVKREIVDGRICYTLSPVS